MSCNGSLGRNVIERRKKAKKNGEPAQYTMKQLQHMNKDESFSVKHGQIHYGYKSHIKLDMDQHLIQDFEVPTASVHDSDIDWAKSDEVIYRDKAFIGK